ncbi:MAG TPA: hypothetical protein DCF49_09010 [Lachnospiraceae bacterium]|nr:hypothetical protein [Lachnospiraceae bacterium]
MKRYTLRNLLFLTLCCDLGLFSKRLISPAANILTDFLRIPGGIGTSFSLMFLVVAAALVPVFGCATLMALVQSLTALSLGMVGSMGILSPVGYIVPGIVIDLLFVLSRKAGLGTDLTLVIANMLGAASAGLTANFLVFRLPGVPLALYIAVALASGAVCGCFAGVLVRRLRPVMSSSASAGTDKGGAPVAKHVPGSCERN